jgi:hypothetical protein
MELQAEIDAFATTEDLQAGAVHILKCKNRLCLDDAKLIEGAFASKLAELDAGQVQIGRNFYPSGGSHSRRLPTPTDAALGIPGAIHVATKEPVPKRRGKPTRKRSDTEFPAMEKWLSGGTKSVEEVFEWYGYDEAAIPSIGFGATDLRPT